MEAGCGGEVRDDGVVAGVGVGGDDAADGGVLASRAVMPAPVAVRQVRALTALGPLAMAAQMAAQAEREARLKLPGA